MSELMKKASKEAYNKKVKENCVVLVMFFMTKQEVLSNEAIQGAIPMRHPNSDVAYIPTGVKKSAKLSLNDTNIYH